MYTNTPFDLVLVGITDGGSREGKGRVGGGGSEERLTSTEDALEMHQKNKRLHEQIQEVDVKVGGLRKKISILKMRRLG